MMVQSTLLAAALLLSPLALAAPTREPLAPLARRQYDNSTAGAQSSDDGTMSIMSDQSMPSKYGETCIGWPQKNTDGQVRASVQCSYIPEGLQLAAFLPSAFFVHSDPFWDNEVHYTPWADPIEGVSPDPVLGYFLRDGDALSDCTVKRNEKEKSWYERNDFEAVVTCSRLPSFAKVRAYMDMYLQIDEYSSWMNGPITTSTSASTGYHRPTDPRVDPTAKMEFDFAY